MIYTDEDLKWDKILKGFAFLIHLSATFPLNLKPNALWAFHFKSSMVYNKNIHL